MGSRHPRFKAHVLEDETHSLGPTAHPQLSPWLPSLALCPSWEGIPGPGPVCSRPLFLWREPAIPSAGRSHLLVKVFPESLHLTLGKDPPPVLDKGRPARGHFPTLSTLAAFPFRFSNHLGLSTKVSCSFPHPPYPWHYPFGFLSE